MSRECGSDISRALSLYFVIHNQVAFTEHFIKKAWRKKKVKCRFFHMPAMLSEDAVVLGGRSHGKSFAILEPRLTAALFRSDYADEEIVLSAFRRLHVKDRMENVISILYKIPYFKAFILHVRRQPNYEIKATTGVTIHGISVGDDPTAISIQGKHPVMKIIEEGQSYTMNAWKQWQSTVHPEGCKELYCGVVDGRVDTPFRHLDTPGDPAIDKFANKRFHIPRYFDPWWNEALKQDCIKNLGGEVSDEYLQQVKAKWGSPASAVWDILAIYDCMHRNQSCPRFEYDATTVDEFSEIYLPEKPKDTRRIALGIDTGYTEPTEIACFAQVSGRWQLFCRVGLRGKIIYEIQAKVIDKIASFYNAEFMGIDSTSSPVIASILSNTAGAYKDKDYADRVVEVAFNENIEYEISGEKRKSKTKNFATDFLRSMFKKLLFELPLDEELVSQFNSEKQKKTSTHLIILTPDNVHITDSFRCFVVAYFKKYMEDFIEQDKYVSDPSLPMAGNTGVFRGNSPGSIVDRVVSMFPGLRRLQ